MILPARKLCLAAAALLFSFATLAPAADAVSFSIPQVMSAPFASTLVAWSGGPKVAWVQIAKGKRNIWIAAGPDWKARQLTAFNADDGQDISDIAWAPDGTYLLFARGGDFENGGENPNPGWETKLPSQDIWYAPLNGPPARKIAVGSAPAISPKGDLIAFPHAAEISLMSPPTADATKTAEPKVVLHDKGTISALEWSPDGTALAFVTRRSLHSFIGVYDVAAKSLRYLDPSVDRDAFPEWSPDSSHIAYVRTPTSVFTVPGPHREGPPWSIRVTDLRTSVSKEIFQADPGSGSVFHALASGRQLFWTPSNNIVFPWERTGWCHLYSVPSSGGSPLELTPGEGEVENASAAPTSETIYYSTNIGDIDGRHLWSVSPQATAKRLTLGESIDTSPEPSEKDSTLAYLRSSYNSPTHAAVRMADGTVKDLAPESIPSEFPSAALVKPQAVILTAADGMPIHAQLFLPPGLKAGERRPTLVFFHGGSRRQMLLGFHYMYYYSNAYSMNQYLANHGYVVLSVNYRSGIGYGLNFREALHYGVAGGSEYNDVIGAGLYLKSRPDVDPKRIGVWGGSYGGYLTAMALARASDMFAAGVDFHGVHDWSTLRGYGSVDVGGDPKLIEQQRDILRVAFESSPMAYVDGWKSPVLLIHGDDDRNVEFRQDEELVEALRARHVEFQQLIFPNEIHDFLLQRSWVTAYQATAAFFDSRLGSPYRPTPPLTPPTSPQ
jgi:dipeptidyl aminopeptidase/acylaminoacyl peptidase